MTIRQFSRTEARKWAQSGPEITSANWREVLEIAYAAGLEFGFEQQAYIKKATGAKPEEMELKL